MCVCVCMCVCVNFGYFLLLIGLMSIWLLDQPEEPWELRKVWFSSTPCIRKTLSLRKWPHYENSPHCVFMTILGGNCLYCTERGLVTYLGPHSQGWVSPEFGSRFTGSKAWSTPRWTPSSRFHRLSCFCSDGFQIPSGGVHNYILNGCVLLIYPGDLEFGNEKASYSRSWHQDCDYSNVVFLTSQLQRGCNCVYRAQGAWVPECSSGSVPSQRHVSGMSPFP